MTRRLAFLRAPVVVGLVIGLASCGGSNHSSADGGLGGGGDGASGGGTSSGEDGSGPGSSGASSSGATSSGASSSGAASSGGSSGATSSGASSSSGADASAAYDPSVYQHHKNGTRNGVYIDSILTSGATGNAATMHALGFMGTVTTTVYAQPLYVQNGPGGVETLIVATEDNHVTAYNATTGVSIWDKGPTTYGNPVTGGLPCGDIPTLGITGTPFIDPASPINGGAGVIYFAAMVNSGGTPKHMVYAVKLSDGSVLPNWPVDVSAKVPSFVSACQNQRGALQFVKGVLYVPYGGLDGDCYSNGQPYYGWVIGFPASSPQTPLGWHTAAPKGGIWGPGALPTDGTSIFPVTGNTSVTGTTWGGGEAVIRLAATATGPTFSGNAVDYYAPTNWQTLDDGDADLGGGSEVIFDMPGAPKPHLVAAGGKDKNFYLLNRDNLGGIGAEIIPPQAVSTNELKGAPAVYTTKTATYVAFHVEGGRGSGCPASSPATGNLIAVKVTPTATSFTASVAWCVADTGLASPMVTTTDGTSDAIVWDANNSLWGYDGDTGAKLFTGTKTAMSTAIQGWNTPIAIGGGRIVVAVNGSVYVFSAP